MPLPVLFTLTLTGSPQQLPANYVSQSVTIAASNASTNTTLVSANATPVAGNSATLVNGQTITLNLREGNTNQIWVNGTAGDKVSVAGV
jgi:hypothetical protein